MNKFLIAAALAATIAAPASALVTGGTLTGGTAQTGGGNFLIIDPIPLGFAVGNDNFQDNNVRAFNERQQVTLLSALTANQGGTLAAGTKVSSHYLVFDPRLTRGAIGTVTFNSAILGVFTARGTLLASDILGNPAVSYLNPLLRGLEAGDSVSFAGNVLNYHFAASTPGDSVRIVTAVPEPTSWAMLIAGFGLVGATLRRKRLAASPA